MIIGRIVRVIEDVDREETLCESKENRRFVVSIFYPAKQDYQPEHKPVYLDLFSPQVEAAENIFSNMGVKEGYLKNLAIHCYNDAPISNEANNLPVIIYSPGVGIDRDMYQFHISQLVSEGYAVITVGATYDTAYTVFPNGEIIYQTKQVQEVPATDVAFHQQMVQVRVKDFSLLLDTITNLNEEDELLKNMFDLSQIGVVGHSLGGAAVFELAKMDTRIKAGVIMDGSLQLITHETKLTTPFLLLRQENSTYEQMKQVWNQEVAAAYSDGQQSLYDTLAGYKSFIKVNNADHLSFSDIPILFNNEEPEKPTVENVHQVINQLSIAFFDEFLKGKELVYSRLINSSETPSEFDRVDRNGEIVKS